MSVKIMAATLEDEGIDPMRALRAAGLDGLASLGPTQRVSAGQELAFQRAFAALTRGRPDIWLKTGFHYKLLSYGAYGLSILTSSTFRQAVTTAVRDDLSYSLAHYLPIESGGAFVGYRCDLSEVPGNLRDFTVFRDAAAIYAAFQDLLGQRFPFTRIELALPEGVDTSLFRPFGCEVAVGAERTAFYWDPAVNLQPMPQADPVLREHYKGLWQQHMPRPGIAESLLARMVHELGRRGGAQVTLPYQARRLGVSERTLQRRLSEAGVSFTDVLNEARKIKAIALIELGALDIAEIAWRLGYSDAASFNHAFRRWTGVSPSRYRRGERADQGADASVRGQPEIGLRRMV